MRKTNIRLICMRPDSQNSMETSSKSHGNRYTINIMKRNDSICFHTNLSHSQCTRAHETIAIYLRICTHSNTVATTVLTKNQDCSTKPKNLQVNSLVSVNSHFKTKGSSENRENYSQHHEVKAHKETMLGNSRNFVAGVVNNKKIPLKLLL